MRWMEDIIERVPEEYRCAGNLEALLVTYAQRNLAYSRDEKIIDLTSLDQNQVHELLVLIWFTATYRGASDALTEMQAEFNEQHRAMGEELSTVRAHLNDAKKYSPEIDDLQRQLHEAAIGLSNQRYQIQALNQDIRETLEQLQVAEEQVDVLLGRSYLFRVTSKMANAVEALQRKLHYR